MPERTCACCGATSAATTCPKCGEASWMAPASDIVMVVLPAPKHEQPPITRSTKRTRKSKRSKPSATAGDPGTNQEN